MNVDSVPPLLAASATDRGLGLTEISLVDDQNRWTLWTGWTSNCNGSKTNPCRNSASAVLSSATGMFQLPEGITTVRVRAKDINDKFGYGTPFKIKHDETGPSIEVPQESTLNQTLYGSSYRFSITARDGSSASPGAQRSGVTKMRITVDGVEKRLIDSDGVSKLSPTWACTNSCSRTVDFNLITHTAGDFGGEHTIKVEAWDAVGHRTAKYLYPTYFPTSILFGGSNGDLDTEAEVDEAIAALGGSSIREQRWAGLMDDDKQDLFSRDALVAWGDEPPLDNSTTDLGSYVGWDGEESEGLEYWIPLADQYSSTPVEPVATAAVGPVAIAVAWGCIRFCDDGIKAGGAAGRLVSRVVKGRRPNPKSWRLQKPDRTWIINAGSKPAASLEKALGQDRRAFALSGGRITSFLRGRARPVPHNRLHGTAGFIQTRPKTGFWLPANEDAKTALKSSRTAHGQLHTRHYYQNVNRTMFKNYYSGAGNNCERVREALRLIRESLRDGSMMY